MLTQKLRGYPACSHQMTNDQRVRDDSLKLVRCVTISVYNHDFISHKHACSATICQFNFLVLPNLLNTRKHEISDIWTDFIGKQCFDCIKVHRVGGISDLSFV